MFQLCFNLNKIHDSVGKALRTADQDRLTANSHALSFSFHPGLNIYYNLIYSQAATHSRCPRTIPQSCG